MVVTRTPAEALAKAGRTTPASFGFAAAPQVTPVATHAPSCALQCGVLLARGHDNVALADNEAFRINRGAPRLNGWIATALLNHPQRLRHPFASDARGHLVSIDWHEAFERVAIALDSVGRSTVRQPSASVGIHVAGVAGFRVSPASQAMDG